MHRITRYALIVAGVVGLVAAVAFYVQSPLVKDFWPWTGNSASGYGGSYGGDSGDLTPLSYYFLSAITIAIALPFIWIGLTGEAAAVRGGAINFSIMYLGLSLLFFQSYASASHNQRLLIAVIVCVAGFVTSVALFFGLRKTPFNDARPMPGPVRISFGVFVVLLLVAGTALLLKTPNVFPWTISAEVSVVYGWIFVGAAGYFVYGILRPYWHNACGQLLGFLGYDLVLILPFLRHFSTVRPEHRLSLVVYVAVLVYSGGLAVYYLFLHPATRIWRTLRAVPAQA